jgi:hypothetical protein
MHSLSKMFLRAAFAASLCSIASAQGPPPDPAHIPFTLPADIKWTGPHGGEYTAPLFGDPSKPAPYQPVVKVPFWKHREVKKFRFIVLENQFHGF